MVNKRGQEGWTLTNLLIALAVLVVVVVGIYYVYSYASTSSEQYLPSDLQKIAVACEVSAKLGDFGKVDYCTQPKPVTLGGNTVYVNCAYSEVAKYITDATLKKSCDDVADKVSMCNSLKVSMGSNWNSENVKVNDEQCNAILRELVGPPAP